MKGVNCNRDYFPIRSFRLDDSTFKALKNIKWESNLSYNGIIEMLIDNYERQTSKKNK